MATRYNENFKIEVVKAYMAGDRSISEIAADYNVAKSTLTGWVKKHGEECQYKTTTKTSQEEFEAAIHGLVLPVPSAGILDGALAEVAHDLDTLVQAVGEERVALIAEAAKPALDPRRVAGVHPQALLALD